MQQYTSIKDVSIFEYLKFAQKPTTVIYEYGIHLAKNLSVIQGFGKPIVSTSANFSGSTAPHFFKKIEEAIKLQVDYIVQYRQEDETPKEASAIIRWVNGAVEIIRA